MAKNKTGKKMTKAQQEQQRKKEQKTLLIVTAVLLAVLLTVLTVAIIKADWSALNTPRYDGATLENAKATHYVTIEIEGYGTLKGELYGKSAPISVNNFVNLAQSGFYEGLTFHRIIEGFMMQGGAANSQSPAVEEIKGEFSENGIENNLLHLPGVMSMARTNDPNSATSQFFIMHKEYPSLDGKYAAFGRITEGLEIVDKICTETENTDSNGGVAAENQPVIKSITVVKA